jgi:hypothetical protein
MKLVDNWKEVLFGSYTVQMQAFGAFMTLASEVVPVLGNFMPWWVLVLYFLGTTVMRLVEQPALHPEEVKAP